MLSRSLPRLSRTGFTSPTSKHSLPHHRHHPNLNLHVYALHPSPPLHHALNSGSGSGSGSLPLSCHSFRMLHSSSFSASTSTSTSSSSFPSSRCFPVRSFSTEGPGRAGAGAKAGAGAGAGTGAGADGADGPDDPYEGFGFRRRFGRRFGGRRRPGPGPPEAAAENPYGDGFKEKLFGKKMWKGLKKVAKWGFIVMFTYYALTDHPNVEGEAWYISILLKPYRTIMAMWPGDDSILIPAETPDQFGRRTRTLVINWENVLVSSEWGRREGWAVRSRQGLDQFLARAYKAGWEIVVFTTAPQEPTEQHILRADPTGGQIIKHRIFYEGTSFHEGFIVKDLNRLGRDLERVVAVDYDIDMYRLQRPNLLKIKKISNDPNDQELEHIVEFLENLSRYNVHDVRPYVAKYNANLSDPNIFAEEEQARIQAAERLRKAKRSFKYTGAADTATITPAPKTTSQPEKEEQGWLGWAKGITGVFSRS